MHWLLSASVVLPISLAGCASLRDAPAQPIAMPRAGTVDRIKVELSNEFDEKWPRNIEVTERDKIDRFIEYLRARNDNWRKPWDTFPVSRYTIVLQRGKETVVVLWVSPGWIGGREGNQGASDNRLKSISPEEWTSLMKLLGVSNP